MLNIYLDVRSTASSIIICSWADVSGQSNLLEWTLQNSIQRHLTDDNRMSRLYALKNIPGKCTCYRSTLHTMCEVVRGWQLVEYNACWV